MVKIKSINWKVLILALAINFVIPLYYTYLRYNSKQGFFGSSINFINVLLWFPLLVFIVSFIFERFLQKLIFNFLSFISVYIILIDDLIKTSFDEVTLQLFFLYIIAPVISASLSNLISKSMKNKTKQKSKKK